MSAKFCILIPSKIFQIEKCFTQRFEVWFAEHQPENYPNSRLPHYSILPLSKFGERRDVNLDLSEQISNRYHVIDFEFNFLQPHILQALLSWLAKIYRYGEIGLLKYWSDDLKRFPPIRIGETEQSISSLSPNDLPLDRLLFLPLDNYFN
ncbi:MAG: hypothetical protein RM021_028590 [Nostoc sp. EkiNYC01]|nr:hypothetical protein [Nostoc sp. EkiNYC01]